MSIPCHTHHTPHTPHNITQHTPKCRQAAHSGLYTPRDQIRREVQGRQRTHPAHRRRREGTCQSTPCHAQRPAHSNHDMHTHMAHQQRSTPRPARIPIPIITLATTHDTLILSTSDTQPRSLHVHQAAQAHRGLQSRPRKLVPIQRQRRQRRQPAHTQVCTQKHTVNCRRRRHNTRPLHPTHPRTQSSAAESQTAGSTTLSTSSGSSAPKTTPAGCRSACCRSHSTFCTTDNTSTGQHVRTQGSRRTHNAQLRCQHTHTHPPCSLAPFPTLYPCALVHSIPSTRTAKIPDP